jgi:hypothetical protein
MYTHTHIHTHTPVGRIALRKGHWCSELRSKEIGEQVSCGLGKKKKEIGEQVS